MKIRRLIVIGFIGMVLAFGLSGCKIISASPDPNQVIEMKIGESKTFEVDGPAQNNAFIFYDWSVDYENGGYGKKFTFTADPQKYRLSNRMWVTCELAQMMLLPVCGPQAGDPCHLDWVWAVPDEKAWKIRIVQDGPVWQGDYYIADNTDLQVLKDFTSITGSLIINNSKIISTVSLENLTSVGGDLIIEFNPVLTSLAGLENLRSVGGILEIWGNPALTSISHLENLTSVGGDLRIEDNDVLTSISALKNLTSIGGGLGIWDNDALTNLIGLENIISVSGYLTINYNDTLTSLTGLENVTSVGRGLRIEFNPALTNLSGLENITSVGGDLIISFNPALTFLGMAALQNVNWNFEIFENSMLCSLLAEELRDQVLAGGGIGGEVKITGNKDCTTP